MEKRVSPSAGCARGVGLAGQNIVHTRAHFNHANTRVFRAVFDQESLFDPYHSWMPRPSPPPARQVLVYRLLRDALCAALAHIQTAADRLYLPDQATADGRSRELFDIVDEAVELCAGSIQSVCGWGGWGPGLRCRPLAGRRCRLCWTEGRVPHESSLLIRDGADDDRKLRPPRSQTHPHVRMPALSVVIDRPPNSPNPRRPRLRARRWRT